MMTKAMRKRYIQHPQTLQLVPAEEYEPPVTNRSAYVIQDTLDSFIADATATPTEISSRSQLRRYCKENGLTLSADCQGLPFQRGHEPYNERQARDRVGAILQRQLFGT